MEQRKNKKTIRFNDEELTEGVDKMQQYGYGEMSAFVRFAIRQLPKKK